MTLFQYVSSVTRYFLAICSKFELLLLYVSGENTIWCEITRDIPQDCELLATLFVKDNPSSASPPLLPVQVKEEMRSRQQSSSESASAFLSHQDATLESPRPKTEPLDPPTAKHPATPDAAIDILGKVLPPNFRE